MRRRRYLSVASAALVGLSGCLGDPEYTVIDVTVPETPGTLTLDVEPVDTSVTVDSPARLSFTLRNDGDSALSVRTTGVWPFGLLALALPRERGPERILLLSDRYAESDHVQVSRNSVGNDNEPLVRQLTAGESVSRRYEIHGDRLYGAGTYTLRGYFEPVPLSYRSVESTDWTAFRPEVTVRVGERSLLP
ncbi:hypothetical protein [Haloarcula salina]|uniref:DUF8130 domain-containing protein n=1 Tax=Haloarcula salina TaxID=1429914 RepID=A0AA41G265_9EURY|nr:hypothetical protein [Haloarcula salina]MBV0903017.1 hypothetical protein [Haloarcula salina]